jgi:ABC-type branched-subunit amino acid transport system permease subunit
MEFYISTLVVYFGIDLLSAWSLNLQFGYAGVPNFAYIVFQSIGAYTAAVLTLGPDSGVNSFQHYLFGASLPFPIPLIAATLAGGLLSLILGSFALRRIRRDYQAAVLLIVSLIATQVISTAVSIFNGSNGLTGVPKPFSGVLNLSLVNYQWAYAAYVLVICVGVYFLLRRLLRSNWGRAIRAVRDHEDAAATVGLNGTRMRMHAFVLGGMIAGLSGALLVQFVNAWSPASWGYAETFGVLTAVIIGGLANNKGAIVGTLLVQIIFLQLPSFLPQIGYPGLTAALQWIVIGGIWLIFMAVRPKGLLPERRYSVDLARFGLREKASKRLLDAHDKDAGSNGESSQQSVEAEVLS